MNLNLYHDVPDGLSRRATTFVSMHGVRAEPADAEAHRAGWRELGVPDAEIDRAVAFQRRWGGLVLPPGPLHDDGPRYFEVDTPEEYSVERWDGPTVRGWWLEAGVQRSAVPYSFVIGPDGAYGVLADRWVPLHESVEGWIESLALTYHATAWARRITKVTGATPEEFGLDGFAPVAEVRGMGDTWWRGADSLVAVHLERTVCLGGPATFTAWTYSGLDEWGLHGL
ncbi:hypothetical protein Val02_08760 [Virgisporangium aliadipatigenens]|uniref:Uncharacterized protein n=1 Tax=Virgisporangium aliadipatigenens TaxID=741659 RepID=A0A8J4DMP1_9ACTN|nr:hypothetical protein [Virgisporangium aliadipatigenens]GIJ43990.1 hypothetical protein Val02_08760 [Virgisporangium aliadipatigenens]